MSGISVPLRDTKTSSNISAKIVYSVIQHSPCATFTLPRLILVRKYFIRYIFTFTVVAFITAAVF